jgi:hypothetical protein
MPTVQTSHPARNNFNIRVEVTLQFQNAVNEGSANWHINATGGTELHFKNGEIYQLDETNITRVK